MICAVYRDCVKVESKGRKQFARYKRGNNMVKLKSLIITKPES